MMTDGGQFFAAQLLNPRLSDFCTRLTGITQETVDAARPFAEVLDSALRWLGSEPWSGDQAVIGSALLASASNLDPNMACSPNMARASNLDPHPHPNPTLTLL